MALSISVSWKAPGSPSKDPSLATAVQHLPLVAGWASQWDHILLAGSVLCRQVKKKKNTKASFRALSSSGVPRTF